MRFSASTRRHAKLMDPVDMDEVLSGEKIARAGQPGHHAPPGAVVYISGPMTGIANFNREAFDTAAATLRAQGYTVLSPAEMDHNTDPKVRASMQYADYIRRDVAALLGDGMTHMYMLPGWRDSKGARLEHHLAQVLGMTIIGSELSPVYDAYRGTMPAAPKPARTVGSVLFEPSVVETNAATGGKKAANLVRYDLVPTAAMAEVAYAYGLGAKKYDDHNWKKGIKWSLLIAAMQRHIEKWKTGQSWDPDGQHHLASVAFHALALMEYENIHPELDDRYRLTTE